MAKLNDKFTIIIEKGKKRMIATSPLNGIRRLVFVINHQFTNAPNTTQISSGAGFYSTGGTKIAKHNPPIIYHFPSKDLRSPYSKFL